MIKLLSIIKEAKLDFKSDNKISPEDIKKAASLLYQYFKERGTLDWMYAQEWKLTNAKIGYGWDGDRYEFEYSLKGKEQERKPFPEANWTKKYKIFRNPKNAVDYIVASERNYEDKYVFRGMSMAELIDAKKKGYIASKGEYNFSHQQGFTLFGKEWSTANSYASGFAPYDREPTRNMPGVIIAVPKELTQNAKELEMGVDTEYMARKIPIDKITGLWIIVPVESGIGNFDLINKNGKLSDGSRTTPHTTYAVVPKYGIALN